MSSAFTGPLPVATVMVGAATVRTDNPRLLVRSQARRERRAARGLVSSPMKITVTDRLDLDARSDFFTTGEAEKLVYTSSPRVADARARLGPVATIVDGGLHVRMRRLSEDLADRGVERLMWSEITSDSAKNASRDGAAA